MNATGISEHALPTGTFVDVGDGLRLHLHDVGAGTEGSPILWLHGSGPGASGWSNFGPNAEVLQVHGYRSILLDSLGYGRSDRPVDRAYELEEMAGRAVAAMDALGIDRFTIVGNSQGGAQAIRIALDHPDRVDRLVLMAPGGLESRDTYMALSGIRSMMRCIYGPEGITPDGMVKLFSKQVFDAAHVPHDVIALRYEVAATQPRHVFESMRVPDQSERLGELAMPVLALWGMDDVFCPPSGALKIAERVGNARVVLLTRCGHWVMVEHADVFNRTLLDFLRHG
ncbi:MAG: alpha/beta fold hydrolase [Alphaproteobacteria bacterium]|nr:alpha/beta fold hydrolase [Alphaproteobacteria bacterium]